MRLIAIALLIAVGCGSIPPADYPTTAPEQETVLAPLGIGDVVEITIYNGSKENRATFRIDPTGRISVQYIGEVVVLGKKPDEVREDIQKRLADGYLVDPIVSVIVTEINSLSLSISGEIGKDGKIKFTPGMTIVDAIALSGGFTPMAKKNHVKVVRTVGGKDVIYKIPVDAIQDGERPNFYVAAGDRIFVPERLW
ncbi:MAG: polysaccharide biosynthesis/export family protein [Kofleriaceae bacterium]